jgi:hypothetical protein
VPRGAPRPGSRRVRAKLPARHGPERTPHHDALHLGDRKPLARRPLRLDGRRRSRDHEQTARRRSPLQPRAQGVRGGWVRRAASAARPGEGSGTSAPDGDTGAFAKGESARASSCGDGTSSRCRRRRVSSSGVGTPLVRDAFRRAARCRGDRNGEYSRRKVRVAIRLDGNLRGPEAALRALALFSGRALHSTTLARRRSFRRSINR